MKQVFYFIFILGLKFIYNKKNYTIKNIDEYLYTYNTYKTYDRVHALAPGVLGKLFPTLLRIKKNRKKIGVSVMPQCCTRFNN